MKYVIIFLILLLSSHYVFAEDKNSSYLLMEDFDYGSDVFYYIQAPIYFNDGTFGLYRDRRKGGEMITMLEVLQRTSLYCHNNKKEKK